MSRAAERQRAASVDVLGALLGIGKRRGEWPAVRCRGFQARSAPGQVSVAQRSVLGRVGVISTDMEEETDERTETAFFR